MIFRAVDLETNGVDVEACEVAQVALVSVGADFKDTKTQQAKCSVSHMPAVVTKIHGLTMEELASFKPFPSKVRGVLRALTSPGVIVVTFNGAKFDLPVIARYAARHGKLGEHVEGIDDQLNLRERFEELFAAQHIDVCRVWQVARSRAAEPPWAWYVAEVLEAAGGYAEDLTPVLNAGMFAGSLTAAHGFWLGRGFDGAHDAGVDCEATLAVLKAMLDDGFVDVESALRMSSAPLPGCVDFEGVFKWDGDQARCTLKKHADSPIEKIDRGFLQWMLDPERTFHRHTKHVVREYLAGRYPIRTYEEETE